ncbi:unnamed protein product [Sphagnum balticum]
MKGKNLYSPMAIVQAVNEVKGVNASFIDHHDARCPCYVDWGPILKKHFNLLPARYTFNYFFEFDEGHVNMRSPCSMLDNEAINIPLVNATNISLIRQSLLSNLFNAITITIEQVAFLLTISQNQARHTRKTKGCSRNVERGHAIPTRTRLDVHHRGRFDGVQR